MKLRRTLVLALFGVLAVSVFAKDIEAFEDDSSDSDDDDNSDEEYDDQHADKYTPEQKKARASKQKKALKEKYMEGAYKAMKKQLKQAVYEYAVQTTVIKEETLKRKKNWDKNSPITGFKIGQKGRKGRQVNDVIKALSGAKTKKIVMKDRNFKKLLADAHAEDEDTIEELAMIVLEKYLEGDLKHVPKFPKPSPVRSKKKTKRGKKGRGKAKGKGGFDPSMLGNMGEMFKNPQFMQQAQEMMKNPDMMSKAQEMFKDPQKMAQMQNMFKGMGGGGGNGMPDFGDMMKNMDPQKMQDMMGNKSHDMGGDSLPETDELLFHDEL